MTRLCMEARADALIFFLFRQSLRGFITHTETHTVPLPPGVFGHAGEMAACVLRDKWWLGKRGVLPRTEAVAVINTSQVSLRCAAIPTLSARDHAAAAKEMLRTSFPMGDTFNETTHVFSHGVFTNTEGEAVLLMAALPCGLADALTELLRALAVPLSRIKGIDLLEHRLLRHHIPLCKENRWFCVPQEHGIRVLAVSTGLPRRIYSLTHDPNYRQCELERIWCAQSAPYKAEQAYLFNANDDCLWLHDALNALDVTVTEMSANEAVLYHPVGKVRVRHE